MTQLSDSIWVLKNEQLHATTLADRFKAWAQRMMQNYPHINYYYDENITNNIEFTPYKALNIFLILKECLNNALKHSGCTAINIRFASNEHLHISLKDNGIGFQHEPQKGNGMENMKRRAEESKLHIEWLPYYLLVLRSLFTIIIKHMMPNTFIKLTTQNRYKK